MKFKKMPIENLIPDPGNPREDLQPGDPEYEKIKKSLDEFELVDPIVFDSETKYVIGGHQRLAVLKNEGVKTLNVIPLGGISWAFTSDNIKSLTEAERKALNIALNNLSGRWDMERLTAAIEQIYEGEIDPTITGFSDLEISGFLGEPVDLGMFLTPDEKAPREKVWHTCPKCGEKFQDP